MEAMEKTRPRVGVLLYTYNRIDDARINLEIIRNVWQKHLFFRDVVIVHAFNGEKKWWPKKYLENNLIQLKNGGHFAGAVSLMDAGVECFAKKHPKVDYVVTLAADTWLVKPSYLEKIIKAMAAKEKYFAATPWANVRNGNIFTFGASLDFNIIDVRWATKHKLFPMRYEEFRDKYSDLLFYQDTQAYPERVILARFKEAIMRLGLPSENLVGRLAKAYLYIIKEREPVHAHNWRRKMYWPAMGLITHHEPQPKQKALKTWELSLGKYGNAFLKAKKLDYYNNSFRKTAYINGDKKFDYGD